MKKYVLGPNAARKLKALLAKSDGVSRRQLAQSGVAYDLEYAAPFTVQWAASANSGDGAWLIWMPVAEELLTVDGVSVDPSANLEPAGGDYPDGWFKLSGVESSGGRVWLIVSEDENDAEGDSLTVEFGGSEDSDAAFSVLIAETSVSAAGAVSVKQLVCSSLVLSRGANGDKVSIDTVTADDADDPNALQVKNFDNKESDGGQGLAERLEIRRDGASESASYKIVAKENASKVHLVARVNGKIKYIPLSGSDEKDPDEENPPPDREDCSHPGDADNSGGVSPDDDGLGGGLGGWHSGGGGVPPGGGFLHPGDDNCNC